MRWSEAPQTDTEFPYTEEWEHLHLARSTFTNCGWSVQLVETPQPVPTQLSDSISEFLWICWTGPWYG